MTAILLALAALVAVLMPTDAHAQIDGGSIFNAWRPVLAEWLNVAIAAAVAYAANLLRQKFKIEIEANHRDALQTALTNAAGLVIAKVGSVAETVKVGTGTPALDEGVTYVLKAAPDALAYFGLQPDAIREKLVAKLGAQA